MVIFTFWFEKNLDFYCNIVNYIGKNLTVVEKLIKRERVPAARWRNRLGRDVGFILVFGSSLCGWSAIESPRRGKKILRRNNTLLLRDKALFSNVQQLATFSVAPCVLICMYQNTGVRCKNVCNHNVWLWMQGALKAGMKTLLPPKGNSKSDYTHTYILVSLWFCHIMNESSTYVCCHL